MSKRKVSSKIGVFICIFVGLCLVLTGIFIPRMIKQRSFEYSEDYQFDKMFYEFDLETKERLNVDTAYVKIKIGGANTESFKIYFDADESEIKEGDYTFMLVLYESNASMFNKVIEIEINNENGDLLKFEPSMSDSNMSVIPLTIFPIFFGAIFFIVAITIFVSKSSKMEEVIKTVEVIASNPETVVVSEKDKTVTCKYCGLENDKENAKCEYCGGPLYKNK